MRKALEEDITNMQTAFHKENIPVGVYLAFVDSIRRVTRSTRERKVSIAPMAHTTGTDRTSLGTLSFSMTISTLSGY